MSASRLLALATLVVSLAAYAGTPAPPTPPAPPGPNAATTPTPPPGVELDDDDDEGSEDEDEEESEGAEALPNFRLQTGEVTVADGRAKLNLPAAYGFLDRAESRRLLVDLWGNPPDDKVLGMIVPTDVHPASPDGWGIVITYEDMGHVDDADAASIDYADLLKEMKKETEAESEQRVKDGYSPLKLVGWAEAPHYDSAAKKLYWAQELSFGQATDEPNTLNYAIRVLGKEGVLNLNAVAGMNQLPQMRTASQDVLKFVSFAPGHRYEEYDAKTDRLAELGIAGLIAGGVAAKTGLFKGLLVALIAAKKFILIGVVAVGGFLARLFKKKG